MLLSQVVSVVGAAGAAMALPAGADYPEPAAAPLIHLDYATYQGSRAPGAGVDQFLGMRFAKPVLGDLRWRTPQEPDREDKVQDATKVCRQLQYHIHHYLFADLYQFGNLCLGDRVGPNDVFGEDCLFVNVFKPTKATAKSKLPVWVFIQGGGYARNDNGNFNGSGVVQSSGGNVVFVNFNYRTGVLGFLASENVRKDGALNAGLLDQRLLLKWVQKYINQVSQVPQGKAKCNANVCAPVWRRP